MDWLVVDYKGLTMEEFYEALALRVEVFVVEQDCVYQELDGKDKKAFHLLGKDTDGTIQAVARILPPDVSYAEPSIGRVAVRKRSRGKKTGHEMMSLCINFMKDKWPGQDIRISAQTYLQKYYETHGFVDTGKAYLEDGIPHLEMLLKQ
jgi:ElaA protein